MPPYPQFTPIKLVERYIFPQMYEIDNIVSNTCSHRYECVCQQIILGLNKNKEGYHGEEPESQRANRNELEIFYGLVKPIHAQAGKKDSQAQHIEQSRLGIDLGDIFP